PFNTPGTNSPIAFTRWVRAFSSSERFTRRHSASAVSLGESLIFDESGGGRGGGRRLGAGWDSSGVGRLLFGGRGRGLLRFARLSGLFLGNGFVQNQHPMGGQIVIPGESLACEKVVHRFVKVQAHVRGLVVEQKVNLAIVFLPHAHFYRIR